jgi:hypothetical protein
MDLKQFKWWDTTGFRPLFSPIDISEEVPIGTQQATNLTLTSSVSSVHLGSNITLTATLTVNAVPLNGYAIVFEKQTSTSGPTTWASVGTSNTNASGVAVLVLAPSVTTTYRATFAGG